ncbi:hypothetical protein OAA09_01025 [bacterium]|nr:hypothetical protein [bacterium]
MKSGDMVRFAKCFPVIQRRSYSIQKKHIGVLLEHDKIQGMVNVLSEGEIYRLRAELVEKAGKKDFDVEDE